MTKTHKKKLIIRRDNTSGKFNNKIRDRLLRRNYQINSSFDKKNNLLTKYSKTCLNTSRKYNSTSNSKAKIVERSVDSCSKKHDISLRGGEKVKYTPILKFIRRITGNMFYDPRLRELLYNILELQILDESLTKEQKEDIMNDEINFINDNVIKGKAIADSFFVLRLIISTILAVNLIYLPFLFIPATGTTDMYGTPPYFFNNKKKEEMQEFKEKYHIYKLNLIKKINSFNFNNNINNINNRGLRYILDENPDIKRSILTRKDEIKLKIINLNFDINLTNLQNLILNFKVHIISNYDTISFEKNKLTNESYFNKIKETNDKIFTLYKENQSQINILSLQYKDKILKNMLSPNLIIGTIDSIIKNIVYSKYESLNIERIIPESEDNILHAKQNKKIYTFLDRNLQKNMTRSLSGENNMIILAYKKDQNNIFKNYIINKTVNDYTRFNKNILYIINIIYYMNAPIEYLKLCFNPEYNPSIFKNPKISIEQSIDIMNYYINLLQKKMIKKLSELTNIYLSNNINIKNIFLGIIDSNSKLKEEYKELVKTIQNTIRKCEDKNKNKNLTIKYSEFINSFSVKEITFYRFIREILDIIYYSRKPLEYASSYSKSISVNKIIKYSFNAMIYMINKIRDLLPKNIFSDNQICFNINAENILIEEREINNRNIEVDIMISEIKKLKKNIFTSYINNDDNNKEMIDKKSDKNTYTQEEKRISRCNDITYYYAKQTIYIQEKIKLLGVELLNTNDENMKIIIKSIIRARIKIKDFIYYTQLSEVLFSYFNYSSEIGNIHRFSRKMKLPDGNKIIVPDTNNDRIELFILEEFKNHKKDIFNNEDEINYKKMIKYNENSESLRSHLEDLCSDKINILPSEYSLSNSNLKTEIDEKNIDREYSDDFNEILFKYNNAVNLCLNIINILVNVLESNFKKDYLNRTIIINFRIMILQKEILLRYQILLTEIFRSKYSGLLYKPKFESKIESDRKNSHLNSGKINESQIKTQQLFQNTDNSNRNKKIPIDLLSTTASSTSVKELKQNIERNIEDNYSRNMQPSKPIQINQISDTITPQNNMEIESSSKIDDFPTEIDNRNQNVNLQSESEISSSSYTLPLPRKTPTRALQIHKNINTQENIKQFLKKKEENSKYLDRAKQHLEYRNNRLKQLVSNPRFLKYKKENLPRESLYDTIINKVNNGTMQNTTKKNRHDFIKYCAETNDGLIKCFNHTKKHISNVIPIKQHKNNTLNTLDYITHFT